MTAEEMTAAVDRIVKLAHALTQLKEQLARCEGVTAHTRAVLASAQAAHRRAEDDEEAARAALVAALCAAPDAAPPPADVPPVLSPERATSPAQHQVDAPALPRRPVQMSNTLEGPLTIQLRSRDMDTLLKSEWAAECLCWTVEQTEISWHDDGRNEDGDEETESDPVDGEELARIRAMLSNERVWWAESIPGGEVVWTSDEGPIAPRKPHQAAPVEKPAPDARQPDIEKQAPAAAAKPAKPPRKPRPSERWTVRESPAGGVWTETYQGGKVDAERVYRQREKELKPGERAQLVTPKGDMLVCCEGKEPAAPPAPALRWRVETRDVGADAWNDGAFGYDDEAEARREYQYALDNSKPGEGVRLRRPDGSHEGEVTVPAATAAAPATGLDLSGLDGEPAPTESTSEPAEDAGASDDDARCDELLRTRTRHPHVVLALPGGGGAGPDWGVVFEGATLGSAIKAQRAAVKRLRGTGGRVRRYENAALVEAVPVAPGGGTARPAAGGAEAAAAEVSP